MLRAHQPEASLAIARGQHGVAGPRELALKEPHDGVVVVDHEHSGFGH